MLSQGVIQRGSSATFQDAHAAATQPSTMAHQSNNRSSRTNRVLGLFLRSVIDDSRHKAV